MRTIKRRKRGNLFTLVVCVTLGLVINFSPLPGWINTNPKDGETKAIKPKKETTAFHRRPNTGSSQRLPNER